MSNCSHQQNCFVRSRLICNHALTYQLDSSWGSLIYRTLLMHIWCQDFQCKKVCRPWTITVFATLLFFYFIKVYITQLLKAAWHNMRMLSEGVACADGPAPCQHLSCFQLIVLAKQIKTMCAHEKLWTAVLSLQSPVLLSAKSTQSKMADSQKKLVMSMSSSNLWKGTQRNTFISESGVWKGCLKLVSVLDVIHACQSRRGQPCHLILCKTCGCDFSFWACLCLLEDTFKHTEI